MSATADAPAFRALEESVARLRSLVEGLSPDQLRTPSYCSDWSVAQVLSHIGSGAVIMRHGIDTSVHPDHPVPANQAVWDEWNAKSPDAQAADLLPADQALIDLVDGMSDEDAAKVELSFGPMKLALPDVLGLRLGEHALHTWDVEVTFNPMATLHPAQTAIVVDGLARIIRFAGTSNGNPRTITVRTSAPERTFVIEVGTDTVSLGTPHEGGAPDVELPAEAFVRLVYGRLDPLHTPTGLESAAVQDLRAIFPGF
jgi:uncharacterized protein (TIGR03083 family)